MNARAAVGRAARAAIVVCLAATGWVGASPATADEKGTAGYIVTLRPGQSAVGHGRAHDIEPRRIFSRALRGYSARLTPSQVAELRRDRTVVAVEPDVRVWAAAQSLPTGLDRIIAPDTPGLGGSPTGDGVDERVDADIAIIDTGSGPHPDLNVVARTDCHTTTSCVDGNGVDGNGHGTHVAGTAAALDNGFGVVGVAPGARIWSVQVLGANGTGTLSAIVKGIDWVTARADRIDVANISIQCSCVSPAIDTALAGAKAAGVTMVVAAGNSAFDTSPYSIGNSPDAISTSALADFNGVSGGGGAATCWSDVDDTLADFSNFGAVIDLAAPGVCIQSTWLSAGYATISGTSMAAPHVAGAAALLASTTAYAGNPSAIQAKLQADGNQGWTDTSGDGTQEPLLDITGLSPVTLPATAPLHLSVDNDWVAEGAASQVVVRASRPLVGGEVVTATLATTKGTAVNGQDYTHLSAANVRLEAGQPQAVVPIQTLADSRREGTEGFTVTMSKVTGAVVADSAAGVTIYDTSGQLAMSIGNVTAAEGANPQAQVRLSEPVPAGNTITAKLAVSGGSATSGVDYTPVPTQTLTFAPGTETVSVPLSFASDALNEPDENFTLTLSSIVGARAADTSATATIVDAHGPIEASVSNAWVAEGNTGTTSLPFVVTLSEPPGTGQSVSVTVKTYNSSATSGTDYVSRTATVTFTAGETSEPVPITVNGDITSESNETLKLEATSVSGAVLADNLGYGTIANDDGGAVPVPPGRALSVSDAHLTETGPGQNGEVVLSLSAPPGVGETVRATVTSANGTATAGADYQAVPSTTITFAEGQATASIPVSALADSLPESQESFSLLFSSVVGAVAIDTTATVRVVSGQPPLMARIDDLWLVEDEAGQSTHNLTVILSQAPEPGQTVSVVAATTASSATAGSDYVTVPPTTLVFGPGETTRTVSVTVNGDTLRENVETFSVSLTSPTGMVLEDTGGSVSLVDTEGPIAAVLVDSEAGEGNSGASTKSVTLQLSHPVGPAGQSFTVKVATTTGGTATPVSDYTTLALTTLTLTAGQTSVAVPVSVIGDTTPEQNETVRITASAPTGGVSLVDATANLTILNDD